jgi:hypothetical protein
MKIIKDGDCYNQVLYTKDGRQYDTISEPTKEHVLEFMWYGSAPTVQYANYYLCKTDAGFILEAGDDVGVLLDNGVTRNLYLSWLTADYFGKAFSWQKEATYGRV